MATITKLNGDSAADTIYSEIEQAAHDLARFADMVGNGKLVALDCAHIKNHCVGIRSLNGLHRREYDPAHDDSIMALIDRCGKLINSQDFAPSVSPWFLRDMQACVTRMRQAVAKRLMSHHVAQRGTQPEPARQMRRVNDGL